MTRDTSHKPSPHDSICYKRNYIDRIIARVNFASPIELFSKLPVELEKAILKQFAIKEPLKQFEASFTLAPEGTKTSHKETGYIWAFHSKDRTKTLELSCEYFAITFTKYEKFEELQELFINFSNHIYKHAKYFAANRIGLRYVNKFSFDDPALFDYSHLINNNLLCSLNFPDDKAEIARSFNSLVLNKEDSLINIQYGIYNPDFPARIRKKEFILDIDCYSEGLVENDVIHESLYTFHANIQNIFESSITEQLRRNMNNA